MVRPTTIYPKSFTNPLNYGEEMAHPTSSKTFLPTYTHLTLANNQELQLPTLKTDIFSNPT
jgi:hypothetical protein